MMAPAAATQPLAFWAKIAVDLPYGEELLALYQPYTFSSDSQQQESLWRDFVATLEKAVPSIGCPGFDEKWKTFAGFRESAVLFIVLLKFMKSLDAWTMRQESHRLQAWLQLSRAVSPEDEEEEAGDEYHVYIAADVEEHFEFLTRLAATAIHSSFLRIHGLRDHEVNAAVSRNRLFYEYFGPSVSIVIAGA
jgi:hypothetical protein